MKIYRESVLATESFGNIARNDLFEYNGKLFMKVGLSGGVNNVIPVGDLSGAITMEAADIVHVVDSITYVLKGNE